MDIQIGNPNSLWLLVVVAAGLVLTGYANIARRRAVRRFATARLQHRILPPYTTSRHWMSALLIGSSMSLLCLAMMDIRWGKTWREVQQKGIEVMFVLDVSRSMLAEDATPNRLSRARQQIKDMVDEMAGDRVGLVVFAGDSRQSVPLTSHYDDFIQTLDSVGPHSVRVGGSRLGDALKAAANGFISKTNGHKSIVVFTDGDDQKSEPIEIAKQIHLEQGIRIFTVGLGDTDQGARIPETDARRGGFVQYEGQQVWSKMNGQILSQIATDTDGAYIPAGTRRVNMADVYHGYVANVEQTEFETAKINTYTVRFQWFAAPALALLLLEVWLSTRSSNGTWLTSGSRRVSHMTSNIYKRLFHSSVALVVIAIASDPASAQFSLNARETAREINAGNRLLREGRVDEALEAFGRIVPGDQQRDELNYNMAVAEYRNGNIDAAEKLFGEVAGAGNPVISSNSRYNLGNCRYTKAVQVAEQDRPAAIGHLRDAVAHYRGALRANSNNPDARANIELAGALIRKLEQEQQDEQQKQEQEKEQEDKSNEGQQKDQKDQSEQKNEEPGDEKQDSGDQKSPGEESQSDQQQPSEQQPPQTASDGKQIQSQNKQQQSAGQQQPDDDPKPEVAEAKNEAVSAGDLKAAGQQDEKKKPDGSVAMAESNAKDGLMTREEALKMLQSVRDRDMLRRMQQQRQERSRHVPVDRDW